MKKIGLIVGLVVIAGRAEKKNDVLHLVSYNVENLFDSVHDSDPALPNGKEDWTFLPLKNPLKKECQDMAPGFYKTQCVQTDWTPQKAQWKLQNMAKAISYMKNKPDILSLAEVENANVVGYLAKSIGYGGSYLVTNSPDKRGIDVALVYNKEKVKLVRSVEIKVSGPELSKSTRNILRAEFKIQRDSKAKLFVYANHWPSQAAPASARVRAAEIMKADIEKIRNSTSDTVYIIAMGDFNSIESESPNPISGVITNKQVWKGALVDAEQYARDHEPSLNDSLCPGSFWYNHDKNWNVLDHIFVSQNLADERGSDLEPATFFIFEDSRIAQKVVPQNGPFAGKPQMVPISENTLGKTQEEIGYSDHFPIGIDLKISGASQKEKSEIQ